MYLSYINPCKISQIMALKIVLICLTFAYIANGCKTNDFDPLSDEFIDYINSLNTTWTAKRNFHRNIPLSYIKSLLGVKMDKKNSQLPVPSGIVNVKDLPENFDPRDKWPYCPSLNEIRDQGGCGSCWAFGAVEMMTDRYCIASEGKKQFHFSAEDLMTCCTDCGYGCDGGTPAASFEYWQKVGIVSGGNYHSGEGCRPYTIEPCNHTAVDPTKACKEHDTPICTHTCQSNYSVEYKNDLKRAKDIYLLNTEEKIMRDLYNRGPVEVSFRVYEDFFNYNTGVYQHVHGEYAGGHAVKLMGWGVENGVKYWLLANSWNTYFGGLGGFVKFLRGSDHCGIEEDVWAGEPDMED